MNPLFIAFLDDNTKVIGGTYQDTKWLSIPKDKKIKRLVYLLPSGDYLYLIHYDKYFHMCEVTQDVNGNNKGNINLEYDYIICAKGNQYICYKINLKNQKIEIIKGDTKDNFIFGLNPDIWRG